MFPFHTDVYVQGLCKAWVELSRSLRNLRTFDVSEITERKEVSSPEQYVLSFLQEVRPEDVEINANYRRLEVWRTGSP